MPRLPRKTEVDAAKCHACHVKRRWMLPSATPATQSAAASQATKTGPSAPPEPAQCHKCHACHAQTKIDAATCHTSRPKRAQARHQSPRKVPRRHRRPKRAQERHQSQPNATSIPKTGGKTIRKDIRVIPRQESKTPGETSELRQDKRGRHQKQQEEHKHQSIKIITKGLFVALQPGRRQKKDEEHKHQVVKIITKGLVVALQPGRRQKKDQEHKHQIIKIVSCCFMPYWKNTLAAPDHSMFDNVWPWPLRSLCSFCPPRGSSLAAPISLDGFYSSPVLFSQPSPTCRPWWRRTPRCPTTGSPGRDVLTCCGLLWSRIVGDPDLGGFWRRSGTGVPRRRQHTVHRHIPRYALFQLSTWQPVGPGLLDHQARHQSQPSAVSATPATQSGGECRQDGVWEMVCERWWLTKMCVRDGVWEMVCERWCVKDDGYLVSLTSSLSDWLWLQCLFQPSSRMIQLCGFFTTVPGASYSCSRLRMWDYPVLFFFFPTSSVAPPSSLSHSTYTTHHPHTHLSHTQLHNSSPSHSTHTHSTYTPQLTHTHTQLTHLNLHTLNLHTSTHTHSTYTPQLTHAQLTHLNLHTLNSHNSTYTTQLTQLNSHNSTHTNNSHNSHNSTHTTQLTQLNSHNSTHTNNSHKQLTQLNSHNSTHTTQLTQLNLHNSTYTTQLSQLNFHNSTFTAQRTQPFTHTTHLSPLKSC